MKKLITTVSTTAMLSTLLVSSASALEPKLQYRASANHRARDLWEIHKVVIGKETPSPRKLAKLYTKSKKRLAPLADGCTSTFKDIDDDYSPERKKDYLKKKVACRYATDLKGVFVEHAEGTVTRMVEVETKSIKRLVESLGAGKPVYKSRLDLAASLQPLIDKRSKEIDELYSALGVDPPKDPFAPLKEEVKTIRPALKSAGKKYRFPKEAKYGNKAVANAFSAKLKKHKLKMVRARMSFSDWKIFKNGIGVPKYRSRNGAVLAKKKGERHCRLYEMFANADYRGGGRFQKPQAKFRFGEDKFTVSKCKR